MKHHPVFYGKSGRNRFDAPDKSYGVLYAGRDATCAFIETFARATGTSIVTTAALQQHALAELKPQRPLRLADLTQQAALMNIGADARLFAGSRRTAQLWSRALHDHPSNIDGLLYPSRLDPTCHCIVLFEDRAPKPTEMNRQSWYASGPLRTTLVHILDLYSLELIETESVSVLRPKPTTRALQSRFEKM
jgi:hypothetical protein